MKKILVFLLILMLFCTPALAREEQKYTPEELLQIWHQVITLMREAECYPYVELRQGDRGYEVMFLQARLAQLNYYGKAIDPQFGPGTHAAMRIFERTHGLPVNGAASVADQQLLFSSKAKANAGTPAGLEAGETVPPEGGFWPDDEPPDWWHPLPNFPFFTQAPEFNFPTPNITPTPGPIHPGIDLPEFNFFTPLPIITPKPIIDPGKLMTAFPIQIPEFQLPHP